MATAATGPVLPPVGSADPAPGRPGEGRGRDGEGAFAGALAEALGRTAASTRGSRAAGGPGQRTGTGAPAGGEEPAEAGNPTLVAQTAWAVAAAGGMALVSLTAVAGEAGGAGDEAGLGLTGTLGAVPVATGAAGGAPAAGAAGAGVASAPDGALTREGVAATPPDEAGAGRPLAAGPGSEEPFPEALTAGAGNGPAAPDRPTAGSEVLPGGTGSGGVMGVDGPRGAGDGPEAAAPGDRLPEPAARTGPAGSRDRSTPLPQVQVPAAEGEDPEILPGDGPAAARAGQPGDRRPAEAAGPETAALPEARERRTESISGPEALSGERPVTEAPASGIAAELAGAGDPARAGEVGEAGGHDRGLRWEPGLAEQVARAMERARLRVRPDGETQVRIRLEPPELGEIHLRLTLRDGQIHGQILVGRPEVREALEAQKAELWSRLQEQGVQVGGLDVGLAGGWGAPRHGEAHPGRRSGHRGALAGGEEPLPGLAPAGTGEEAARWPGGRGSRRIDFRA
ncbi:MAG: flagellar hook-length control protein FliK [Firmicutes bacterium]|nr:flagellar hook-length control protein FliK [Bacillota bacterium]